jgi:aldehyde dehydrogenase (NAD+)
MTLLEKIQVQREYFKDKKTLSYQSRKDALKKLREAIYKYEEELYIALEKDLGKSTHEAYMTEIGVVLKDLTYFEKHLKKMMKEKKVKTHLVDFPARSFIKPHPYGNSLIISPWNYPVNLTLSPLIGALASGNTAIIKPSEFSVNTASVLSKMIGEFFDLGLVAVINGGVEVNQELLNYKFDYIFFTGSTNVGKIVMEKASKFLTPVSLELGGKSPTIVDKSANIAVSAKRIVFGKYLNLGQTCVAPDYLFVHKDIKDDLLEEMKKVITEFYGENPLDSEVYGKIINERHYHRLCDLLQDGNKVIGGTKNNHLLKISPTIIDDIKTTDKIMQEEIFGPLLPVLTYQNIDEVITYINTNPNPLALYLFTEDKKVEARIMSECLFGGGCVNDTIMHIASDYLPFGGVGESGIGAYHGKASFDTFTHYKSILRKATWLDLKVRYIPYTISKSKLVKLFLK